MDSWELKNERMSRLEKPTLFQLKFIPVLIPVFILKFILKSTFEKHFFITGFRP